MVCYSLAVDIWVFLFLISFYVIEKSNKTFIYKLLLARNLSALVRSSVELPKVIEKSTHPFLSTLVDTAFFFLKN